MDLSKTDIDRIIKVLPSAEAADLIAMFDELDERKRVSHAQTDFLAFIAAIDRSYKFGVHLKRLGHLLMDVDLDVKERIAVSMAPRMGKSQMISIYFPAWYLGRHPDHKVIVASHTADLAVVMARKVRNLLATPEYQRILRLRVTRRRLRSGIRPKAVNISLLVWAGPLLDAELT